MSSIPVTDEQKKIYDDFVKEFAGRLGCCTDCHTDNIDMVLHDCPEGHSWQCPCSLCEGEK